MDSEGSPICAVRARGGACFAAPLDALASGAFAYPLGEALVGERGFCGTLACGTGGPLGA